jgi:hypothetical protein
MASKKKVIYRSSITGQIITRGQALRSPMSTEREVVCVVPRGPTKKKRR